MYKIENLNESVRRYIACDNIEDIVKETGIPKRRILSEIDKRGLRGERKRNKVIIKEKELNLAVELYKDGIPIKEICKKCNMSKTSLVNKLQLDGIQLRLAKIEYSEELMDKCVDLYKNKGIVAVAKELGVSETVVLSILQKKQVETRKLKRFSDVIKNTCVSGYVLGMTSVELGEMYNIHPNTILSWVKEAGFETRGNRKILDDTVDKICDDYKSGMNFNQIAKKYKLSSKTVRLVVLQNGIESRGAYKITSSIENSIVKDYLNGMSSSAVAVKYNISARAVLLVLEKNDINKRRCLKVDDTLKKVIVSKYNETHNYSEVARQVGLSETTIRRHLKNK